jgi:hypothetical protein
MNATAWIEEWIVGPLTFARFRGIQARVRWAWRPVATQGNRGEQS